MSNTELLSIKQEPTLQNNYLNLAIVTTILVIVFDVIMRLVLEYLLNLPYLPIILSPVAISEAGIFIYFLNKVVKSQFRGSLNIEILIFNYNRFFKYFTIGLIVFSAFSIIVFTKINIILIQMFPYSVTFFFVILYTWNIYFINKTRDHTVSLVQDEDNLEIKTILSFRNILFEEKLGYKISYQNEDEIKLAVLQLISYQLNEEEGILRRYLNSNEWKLTTNQDKYYLVILHPDIEENIEKVDELGKRRSGIFVSEGDKELIQSHIEEIQQYTQTEIIKPTDLLRFDQGIQTYWVDDVREELLSLK